ncbi:RNA-processing protein HAT helix repeating-containing protein [Chthoniobacter flavus Ellin428]|uniref:RNA-processing protein HAT helix repeating-containing protein n=1 Tax=Chthoniobacter flavus Ellin428 TaxID=497964 RepID=B4D5L0_9BACT|nr:tetratricopeptide repeat protein [Chthoniobacter flavus]EDY18415.1 RNA-processing protein HAT helix repeating-containing protein [Chthoniobacter flavus Ellin428]TCO90877.1 tetratricopeptide repeat protein [Chthoniobacter flavus]
MNGRTVAGRGAGSLMNFLQHMPPLGADGIFWTYRSTNGGPDELPSDRIQKLVKKHQGWLVPVYGFDELMAQFAELFGVSNLSDELQRSAKETCERYKKASRELIYRFAIELAAKATGTEKERLYRAAIYHAEQSDMKEEWGYWEIRAIAARNPDDQEKAYLEGLSKLPESAPLLGNYAIFLDTVVQKHDEAEKFYKRAIGAAPKNAIHLGNYANFLTDVRQKHDEAEEFYKRAITADPNHANNLGNYAEFLEEVRNKLDEAEELYRRSVEADPLYPRHLCNYAALLARKPANKPKALELVEAALRISPDDRLAKDLAEALKAKAAPNTANGNKPAARRRSKKSARRKKETGR